MSGGSWDYFYLRCWEVSERLAREPQEDRKRLGELMDLVAEAMKAIEYVDSGDSSEPEDSEAIAKVFKFLEGGK